MRINDRGPYVNGRIIDLSSAAAKALEIRGRGLAKVKLEVVHAPWSIETAGKWCVQIGSFHQQNAALELKRTLAAQYRQAQVMEFAGVTGYWVSVRAQDDDLLLAQRVASNIMAREGGVFLVRLD
jgi:rare lipoprotein A